MKTKLHVPASEEPCTPCKLLRARKILQLQREHNPGQGMESTGEVLKTALAESWKMQQIRKGGSR